MNSDMDSPRLFAADGHPDENQLLMGLEKELPSDEAAQIERHLGKCWSCRARSDEMQRGILAFVEYRERRYLPLLPEPPQRDPNFPEKLRDAACEHSSPGWVARVWNRLRHVLIPRQKIQWASVMAGLIAAVVFWVQVLLVPSSLTAGEILSKAAVAQNPPARFAGNPDSRGDANGHSGFAVGAERPCDTAPLGFGARRGQLAFSIKCGGIRRLARRSENEDRSNKAMG
jgi:anti-sigma factor RsiW